MHPTLRFPSCHGNEISAFFPFGIMLFPSFCVDMDDDAAVDHQMDAVFSSLPEDGGGVVLGVSHRGVEPMGGWATCVCTYNM